MAKGLRSKWKKKMRAVKRVRYGQRELETLKMVVARDPHKPVDISTLSDIATVTDARTVRQEQSIQQAGPEDFVPLAGPSPMDAEEEPAKKYNRKTMKDENGKYPPWFNKRKLRQLSIANKKTKMAVRLGKKVKGGKRRHR